MSVSEYPGKNRPWSKEDVRERIVSDFRDLRFTWRGFFKWTGATILGVIMGALFALYFLDWNTMRGPVARWPRPSAAMAVAMNRTGAMAVTA